MESGNGGASSKGVFLVPVAETSDVFKNSILAPLKSAYLYEESKQSFKYKSAVLVNNPALEEKYCAFRAKRRKEGYSEDDLKESYGFLLFDDVNKANALGETGVLTGNSTCTTLGDPSNGIYISMYSDCLDLNRWYHGKSGYIAIIRLTKGRVKKVVENYTQNFTAPTVGFDCHVSEQLASVSAKTSSFLSFERTQYYMYELLNDGSNVTTQSPSAAYPFAIVSFSYTDTKATLETPQEKSEEKKIDCHYFPWRGQLQIGTQLLDVRLRTKSGALIPAELPPVVKIDRAISMLDLQKLLPKAVFETFLSGEVFLDGLYCSLYELISSETVETNSLSQLLLEIKEKDLALTIQLIDGGFLFLLHPSHFLTYNDTEPGATDVLQGVFVFPDSQVVQRETKCRQRKTATLSEILRVLPVLAYAEGEVEKRAIEPDEELCEVLAQHMQSYAALLTPGLASSPSREVSHFPDQYDVPDAHKHLYSSPEWTNRAWQSFRSYLSKPVSFQLPVSKASEILVAGQEERVEDLVDDVYICLSSPEEAPANLISMEAEDLLTNFETPIDSCIASAEAQVDFTTVPQTVIPDDLQTRDATKDMYKSDLTVPIKTDDMGAKNLLTTPGDLPAELIVSITSAERAVTGDSLRMISNMSATKHNDFQFPGFSTAKLQTTGVNSLNDETLLDCPEVTNLTKTKRRKLCRGRSKGWKTVSKACANVDGLRIQVQDNLNSQKEDQAKESSGHPQLCNPSNIDQRKARRRKCKFRKLSLKSAKLRPASVRLAVLQEKKSGRWHNLESNILMDHEVCPLRKKTERWDLKPVVSECGKILVPHGFVDIDDQVKSLKDKLQSTKVEQCPEKMLVDGHDAQMTHDKMESSTTTETAVGSEVTTSKDGENHFQNIVVSDVDTGHILRLSDDDCGLLTLNKERSEHSSKTAGSATPPSEKVKGQHTDILSPEKIAAKGAFLLSKLKSVLLRGKRNADILVSEKTFGTAQDAETFLKKGRVDPHTGKLKRNYAITSVQDTVDVKNVSKMLSVDPLFAYALGLTPKETPDKTQNSLCQDTQQRTDSSETQELTISEKLPEIIQRPPSIFPRRGRIKTLKKHQGISAEYVKNKWWLHFQTPASYASEKRKFKECTRDNSVRKTVKENINSSCSSTDALNLLADLALSASNDQVPPQPHPALGRKPETRLKKCDLTKDVPSAEQESVLHALLRQPVARPMQPLDSPSHLVGSTELVGLVSKEHAYSLPPSSSLLLGLPGTPFQVSPLSGSSRLLQHHQTMYDNGINTLHPSVGQKDRCELTHRTSYDLKQQKRYRRKFRKSRTFVDKDGSIQITRQWRENYDFNLDSKFTSDSKDKTIVRALHGPWDFSMQDTIEEVQLIVHMWIGLFYSRSTARLFHVDTDSCSEERETSSEMVSAPVQSDLKVNSFVPLMSTDTADPSVSKTLDLSKKDNSMKDQGSLVLDSSAEVVPSDPQVNRKETSVSSVQKEAREALNTLWSSLELQKPITDQCYKKMVQTTEIIDEVNDIRSTSANKKSCAQKTWSPEHIDLPSFEAVGAFISVQEKTNNVSIQPENNQRVSETGHMLHGCSNEIKEMKENTENSEVTEISLLQKHERDSSKSVSDEEVDSNKEAGDLVHALVQNEMETKDGENLKMKLKQNQEGSVESFPKAIHPNDDSTNEESSVTCNENHSENEKQLPSEEPTAVSPGEAENTCESVDGYTLHLRMGDGDYFGKEDGLDEKDNCISPVEADLMDLRDQPVSMTCDGPESIKKDHITESIPEPPLDEQPHLADIKEDGSHDWQFRKLCANGNDLTEEHTISEKYPENYISLTEKAQYFEAALSTSDKNSCSLDGTNDSVKIESQKKVMASPSLSSEHHDDLDIKPMNGEQKVDNTAEKVFHHREAEVALPKEADLKQANKTNRGLENIHNAVVIPFIGIDISGEDTVQPQDSQCKVEEIVQDQEEIPFISETTSPETVLPAGVCSASQMYSQGEELSSGRIPLSLTDVSESQSDERCSTPTMDEKPYDTQSQIETACMKHSLDQTPNPRNEDIAMDLSPNHTSSDFKDRKMSNTTPAVMSASTPQELHTESTGPFLISPFKSKLEEVLGVKLQLQRTCSSAHQHQESSIGQGYCHPDRFLCSTESLHVITPNIDKDRLKTTSQTDLSQEPRPYSQRPVMAVKPSKSDESHADYMSKDNAVMSRNIPVVTHNIPTTMLLKKKTESCRRTSEGLNDDKQDANSSCFSHVSKNKSKFHPDPLYQHQGRDFSKFNKIPSTSLVVQSFESAKKTCKLTEDFVSHSLVENVGQTTKESSEMDQRDYQDASASHADGSMIDDRYFRRPRRSIQCTVYNTKRKRPYTSLEQVPQRCIKYDLTEASMDHECLIFSEQMKQLLKRSKRGPIRQKDTRDKAHLFCASPMTVHFGSLEETEDSVDLLNTHLDASALFEQKIAVDMSDRKYTTEEEKTLHPQKSGNPVEHAGVSGVTSECARLYEAMMKDICAVRKIPSRPKHFRMDRRKTEPRNHFDVCGQMKREMDESFCSNLNSVMKKSCKTKYRFYILVTSDDAFFEETKVLLEAEGHTAVQSSKFFFGEDQSSTLLIILRNEDIAEHVCEIPHLLELKKSPVVQFAGIDEPDDVLNLTHQELFTKGGFIMFDRAVLEPLSLCNIKKVSELLQELSRTGTWKWMLHYRDSRRLKEHARLTAEAKEKKHFINWCQEAGILDVLPYHDCDLVSRDRPDYLACLVRLQVQNISARCPVFITDETTDSTFGKNGILTMTFNSFLTYSPS